MYGLPKIHRYEKPLNPILTMIGSAEHKLAAWLADILEPVLSRYSSKCIHGFFHCFKTTMVSVADSASSFMVSFNIVSLFNNIPRGKTIFICADALYRGILCKPHLPENIFKELTFVATEGVEFSFKNVMYSQRVGVANGRSSGSFLRRSVVWKCSRTRILSVCR